MVVTVVLVRLPTPLQEIFSMAFTNSCAVGREMPRTKNQSKYIHGNSPKESRSHTNNEDPTGDIPADPAGDNNHLSCREYMEEEKGRNSRTRQE